MKSLFYPHRLPLLFCGLFLTISFTVFGQVGIGNTNPKSTLDVNGGISLREGPELILTNNNNVNINLGALQFSQYRIVGPTANFNILTFLTPNGTSAADGQLLTLINTTPYNMTLVHNSGSGANPQRRIYCPNNYNLTLEGEYASVTLQYNSSLQRWVVVGYADLGGYGRNVYNSTGATDTSTNSNAFSDMADMSLTFTPKHSTVYVNFSASGFMDKGSASQSQAYVNFRLMEGNNSIAGTTTLASDRSFNGSGCAGTAFYDTGGPTANYSNNETQVWTFTPTNPGEKVSVRFDSFETEQGYDGLMIYDGPTTSSPIISSGSTYNRISCPNGAWTGIGAFSAEGLTFTSTAPNGELTFRFTSDSSISYRGWEACTTSGVGPSPPAYSLDTAWNAGFTMFPVSVTPGVPTTIKLQWLRDGNPGLPNVIRNNASSEKDRCHRSLTIFD